MTGEEWGRTLRVLADSPEVGRVVGVLLACAPLFAVWLIVSLIRLIIFIIGVAS